jgi:purine-binding chemotaxis protein CheW
MSEQAAQNSVLDDQSKDFLTVFIAGQTFGIPILQIQDVLGEHSVTKVPLAPPEVAGSLNLRGRVVTAINARSRLGIDSADEDIGTLGRMSVVVEHGKELYSLIIDRVGDVITLEDGNFEKTPATLDPAWRDISAGIYRLENDLLVILDVPKFLDSVHG